jgi:hypothetical protein
MLRIYFYRSILIPLVITLFYSAFGAQYAYSQCNVLCVHERGNREAGNTGSSVTKEYGLLLEPSYEVAINDSYYTDAEGDDNSNQLAAGDAGTGTTYIEAPSNKWHFSIIPYLWAAAMSGKVGVRGVMANVSESFSDTLSNLDFGFQLHMEAWRDRFGFFIDGNYSKMSSSAGRTLPGPGQNTLNLNDTSWFLIGELGGFYRVGTWPMGKGTGSYESKTNTSLTLDLIGGGRYWYLKNEMNFKGPVGLNPNISQSESWFDFIVGGRVNLAINKFFVQLRSDVGGFDLGFSSTISWNIAGYIGYELPWYHITPIIGYRALYDKYDSGSGKGYFLWDGWLYGPAIGVAFQF